METYVEWLKHHGIKGQKWGIRNGPPYPIKSKNLSYYEKNDRPYNKNDRVFISGKVKYDKPLNNLMRKEIDDIVKSGSKILIGDAPGADTRVQEYLSNKDYRNVIVYTTDPIVRNNVGGWKVKKINGDGYSDEASIRRQKDIVMTKESTRGYAISLESDRPDSAMSNNISRMLNSNKYIKVFDYEKNEWIEPKNNKDAYVAYKNNKDMFD